MPSWCNSVRVVLLIARGWRGTSLPRVSIRKEIQRRRCWAFSVKTRLQWNILWRINQKKLNTYGVETFTLIYYLWRDSLEYHWKRIIITTLIKPHKLFINHQCRRIYANIPMNVSAIINVATTQRRMFYVGIPMGISTMINTLMVQLGTSCSFDSPGLARNEPTPGKRLQGDSTP